MADVNERDAKLIQYLSEAYGKEQELETALQAHIAMTTKAPYRKRLKDHLKETKRTPRGRAADQEARRRRRSRRSQTAVGKAMAVAKGPLHMIRGSGEQEKMLKNAKTDYFNEHEEIATYLAIEVFAERVGDRETAKLARGDPARGGTDGEIPRGPDQIAEPRGRLAKRSPAPRRRPLAQIERARKAGSRSKTADAANQTRANNPGRKPNARRG